MKNSIMELCLPSLGVNNQIKVIPTAIELNNKLNISTSAEEFIPADLVHLDAIVLQPVINVRSGPSKEYQIIASLEKEDEINAVGCNEDQTWLYIKKDEIEGWI